MEWIQGSISRQEEIGLIVIYMAESDMRKSIILVMVDTKNEIRSAVFRVLRRLTEISSGPQYQLQKEKITNIPILFDDRCSPNGWITSKEPSWT